jgi:hypothetical protein
VHLKIVSDAVSSGVKRPGSECVESIKSVAEMKILILHLHDTGLNKTQGELYPHLRTSFPRCSFPSITPAKIYISISCILGVSLLLV